MKVSGLDEAISLADDRQYGLTSSIHTASLASAMHAVEAPSFGETDVNRENFEAMQGFRAGVRKSGIDGADGKHDVYAYTATHIAYPQTWASGTRIIASDANPMSCKGRGA